jgi:hypothetical protein
MAGLQVEGGGGPRCASCGAEGVGPCASCRRIVCGDCCVLTEGGVETWAICLRCDRSKGRDLRGGWSTILRWFAGTFALLVVLAIASVLLR